MKNKVTENEMNVAWTITVRGEGAQYAEVILSPLWPVMALKLPSGFLTLLEMS